MSSAPAGPAPIQPDPGPPEKRRVVFVVGSGRSGTSTMSGTLQTLGMHVPQPEVDADETNPKGFGEPQWVVDFHDELLKRCNVQVSDARPSAWFEAGKLTTFEPLRMRLHAWLESQFEEGGPELVVKDPRLAWFMGLWRSAALRCEATPAYVTMLRPVTEVVGSKQKYYAKQMGAKFGEVNRTAAWVNMMLHTERSTRGSQRAFVRYHDMLTDWTVPLFGLGQLFDLDAVKSASANDIRKVHQFIDPTLRRVQLTWDDVDVPPRLRDIAQETWVNLDRLADDDGDVPATHDALDQLRTAYAELYDEAEAISQSTALAARREGLAQQPGGPGAGGGRISDKVPHGVRAMVPPAARRGLRRALGRER
ncbi:MAG: sulfotransferase family protein [Nocardioides sp.]